MSSVPTSESTSRSRAYHLEILLISFAALLLEISYTRIVSFKLYYYYTYLVIGLALLGIGTGGVLMAVSGRLRRATTDLILQWGLVLGALSVGVGYLIVARLPIRSMAIWDYGTGSLDRQRRQAGRALSGVVRVVHRRRCDDRDAVRSPPGADRPALLRRPARRRAGVRGRRSADVVGRAPGNRVPRRL